MADRNKPLRWRRCKKEFGPETHELRRGQGPWLVVVQAFSEGGYFWYGCNKNTASEPPLSLEDAKAAAKAHVKASLR
jgi:hypothetical protein